MREGVCDCLGQLSMKTSYFFSVCCHGHSNNLNLKEQPNRPRPAGSHCLEKFFVLLCKLGCHIHLRNRTFVSQCTAWTWCPRRKATWTALHQTLAIRRHQGSGQVLIRLLKFHAAAMPVESVHDRLFSSKSLGTNCNATKQLEAWFVAFRQRPIIFAEMSDQSRVFPGRS